MESRLWLLSVNLPIVALITHRLQTMTTIGNHQPQLVKHSNRLLQKDQLRWSLVGTTNNRKSREYHHQRTFQGKVRHHQSSRNASPHVQNQSSKQPNNNNSSTVSQNESSSSQKVPPQEPERVVEKSRPRKGKAKTVCGCYGTKHKPLTNCLYCGRISCTMEGYDFCSFCGYMVEEVKADGPYVKDFATFIC